ncbi:uncharacterized protein EKO05_0003425 [Ascochyta rabiei]|uniref:uncharacterized protein n=1 Tax=Didymella rabiei TaxID=5454 RepID=UPI0019003289|nr:uncharacterized protein EKO05_0003425 [Ascochyta rabiei]UPX12892.1 hypothetical protein EKO05_0003425 [Ascochyta rabiei]
MPTEQSLELTTNAANVPLPDTPTTPVTVKRTLSAPQAPKKARTKILEYLKPDVYKPEKKPIPKAPKAVLDALSRAGVRQSSSVRPKKGGKKTFPAPRKLHVAIVDGKTDMIILEYVPVRYLMRISSQAATVLEPKPWAGKFKIYGQYDFSALRSVVNAIAHRADIPVRTDDDTSSLAANSLTANLETYEACLRIGISSTHDSVRVLLKAVCAQISKSDITPDILHFVTYRLGREDAVFKHTANVLCYKRFTKTIPDISSFEKMVARNPALQKAMVQIDQAHKARREAINASKRKSMHRNGETGDETYVPTLDKMCEATVDVAPGIIANEQKEALLALLKTKAAGEKDGGSGGEAE